jgi:CheY-like chemotaxis protein/DNA-directed RNA polymerase subunit RPC12/RpoP
MEIKCRQCGSSFRAALTLPLTQPVRVACPSCAYQMVLKPSGGPAGKGAPQQPVRPVTSAGNRPVPPRTQSGSQPVPDSRPATQTGTRPVPQMRPGTSGGNQPLPATLTGDQPIPATVMQPPGPRLAVIADEPRPFRAFLASQLERMGFQVSLFETGEPALEQVRQTRAQLVIVNVYLRGKLGVEVSEDIKADPQLTRTRVVLIGALFRANRFRANPTNLYGADEYIEEQIPEREFRQIVRKLFPEVGPTLDLPMESREVDEARRLARLILSDIIIYNAAKVEAGIRDGTFFHLLAGEIDEGRQYFDSRVPFRVRQDHEIFNETLQQFVQMKREELVRPKTGT